MPIKHSKGKNSSICLAWRKDRREQEAPRTSWDSTREGSCARENWGGRTDGSRWGRAVNGRHCRGQVWRGATHWDWEKWTPTENASGLYCKNSPSPSPLQMVSGLLIFQLSVILSSNTHFCALSKWVMEVINNNIIVTCRILLTLDILSVL